MPAADFIETVDGISYRRGGIEDVPRLETLWVEVHEQHRASMPQLAPYVTDARTWAVRSAAYAELLDRHDGILVVAADDSTTVGYGLAFSMLASTSWLADTWVTGDMIGEIESLAVTSGQRGRGIGSRLCRHLEDLLRHNGVRDIVIGALPGNEAAVALYRRLGYQPTWLYLSKLDGR